MLHFSLFFLIVDLCSFHNNSYCGKLLFPYLVRTIVGLHGVLDIVFPDNMAAWFYAAGIDMAI